ncbi:MAG: NRDE family protein, partial [Rhodoferax sp.]
MLLLSNRDEYYARPTQPLRWWSHNQGPRILAGQDLQAGGTWLGVNQRGWLAALTNFRSGQTQRTDTPSRGGLVEGFLRGDADAPTYLQGLAARVGDYNP